MSSWLTLKRPDTMARTFAQVMSACAARGLAPKRIIRAAVSPASGEEGCVEETRRIV